MHNNKIRWITRTAIFLALLVLLQIVTKPLGQLVTGSVVNLLLAASAVLCGTVSGVVIALISPFLAYFFGIGPAFIQLLPFIALGNLTLALTFSLLLKQSQTTAYWFMAIVAAALLKFIVLYLGVVQLALPLIPNIKSAQLTMLMAMFSWPQLVTASIGGVLAFLLVPPVQKALQNK